MRMEGMPLPQQKGGEAMNLELKYCSM